jgi:hypothetical protein
MEKRITLAVAIALVTGGLSFSGDTLADRARCARGRGMTRYVVTRIDDIPALP